MLSNHKIVMTQLNRPKRYTMRKSWWYRLQRRKDYKDKLFYIVRWYTDQELMIVSTTAKTLAPLIKFWVGHPSDLGKWSFEQLFCDWEVLHPYVLKPVGEVRRHKLS